MSCPRACSGCCAASASAAARRRPRCRPADWKRRLASSHGQLQRPRHTNCCHGNDIHVYYQCMVAPTENPTLGYLLWRLTTRLRAAIDRALAPLGLTHAQYTLLASLYGFTRVRARPGRRELADWTRLDPTVRSTLSRSSGPPRP